MASNKIQIGNDGIYDATQLGRNRMIVLGLQHMFAMFGATILVPLITGLDVSTTLFMAGMGTLLFHLFHENIPASNSLFVFYSIGWQNTV